jgi:hypothetical protein
MRRRMKLGVAAALVAALAALFAWSLPGLATRNAGAAPSTCAMGHGVKHVINIVFDNTHFRRDLPNVPSDLEQMPHLLNFLKSNGTLFTNDHTILISHTAGGILSGLTGLYPDRNGITVSNSYDYFQPNGTPANVTAFKYWTSEVDATNDPLPNMITDGGKNTPAPWVPFTRSGCDVGGVGTANIELENNRAVFTSGPQTGQPDPTGDITRVFGVGSPEWNEAADPATRTKSQADFVGIAIHCAAVGGVCTQGSSAANAKPDPLPDEPGGYNGFKALFGAKYVNPAITNGNACVNDTAGQPVADPQGNCGFPGFDAMLAKNTLGYVAQMQEAGVPVTYAYISDAHDNHQLARASGPGEADYRAQLKAYDDAFAAFFDRLAKDGIDKSNTLFVVTVDEGDHYAGGPGIPQPDGSLAYAHTPCADVTACPSNQIGEVNANIKALLPAGEPAFDIHFDTAPTFYVNGQPPRTDPSVRKLERDVAGLRARDPYVGGANVPLTVALADPVEEKTLHMVNADPKRTPTFTMFGNPNFFFQTTNPTCGAIVCVAPAFAWNHGNIQDEIANTWAGIVGPGVSANGIDSTTWTDHTNLRPTLMEVTGLTDDYRHDGYVLTQALDPSVLQGELKRDPALVASLGQLYDQLNAPFGQFAQSTLIASTRALAASDDATYNSIEGVIAQLTTQRDAVAGSINSLLQNAAFGNQVIWPGVAAPLISQGEALLAQASSWAANLQAQH